MAGLLSFGFLHIKEGPLFSWQALFLCVGGTTFLWGIAILLFLPDSPMRAKVRYGALYFARRAN